MGEDNPSAFPVSSIDGVTNDGMTLRDWFAGQVVTGVLANSENAVSGAEPTNYALSLRPDQYAPWVARVSYLVADAMLAARKATPDA